MVSAEKIQVTLTGGAPWGFRLTGGGSMPLTINKIRKKSRAHIQGLLEGDAVISINGVPVHDKTQDEALELVEKSGDNLGLEIIRGEQDELNASKPKKPISIGGGGSEPQPVVVQAPAPVAAPVVAPAPVEAPLAVVSDSGVADAPVVTGFHLDAPDKIMVGSATELVLSASIGGIDGFDFSIPDQEPAPSDFVISAAVDTTEDAAAVEPPVTMVDSGFVESAPLVAEVQEDIQAAPVVAAVEAEPFVDDTAVVPEPSPVLSPSPAPAKLSPSPAPVKLSPSPVKLSPSPVKVVKTPTPEPIAAPVVVAQVEAPPPAPSVSPQPSHTTTTAERATFDDGQTKGEITREETVTTTEDGSSTTVVQKETITETTTKRSPSLNQDQPSAFVPVQPTPAFVPVQPTPVTPQPNTHPGVFNVPQAPVPKVPSVFDAQRPPPPPTLGGDKTTIGMFRPTKWVPSPKKEIPGLISNSSPHFIPEEPVNNENLEPLPRFQVSNFLENKKSRSRKDLWKPNMWLEGQQPAPEPEPAAPEPEEEEYPVIVPSGGKFGVMKDAVAESPYTPKTTRPHLFAPPVEIHARPDYEYEDEYDDGESEYYIYEEGNSPDSSLIRRKKKQYSDSAFYDTVEGQFPTIDEQMKLCKKIATSLTSAANKRARGAKMFIQRKRKSSKWEHHGGLYGAHNYPQYGGSAWSTGIDDVANVQDLDSEFGYDDGGDRQMFYFKIPSLKGRGGDGRPTKMALSKEQFEKLRLTAKKCEHRNVDPDTCFDIASDLKSSKGRGARMFEKRKQRSDKYVLDENNARIKQNQVRLEKVFSQPVRADKTPWEASMVGDLDAAFCHIDEMEKNMRLKAEMTLPPVKKTVFPPNIQTDPSIIKASLAGDSPLLLQGKDFNRAARGWAGGGEYPVAAKLSHIAAPALKPHNMGNKYQPQSHHVSAPSHLQTPAPAPPKQQRHVAPPLPSQPVYAAPSQPAYAPAPPSQPAYAPAPPSQPTFVPTYVPPSQPAYAPPIQPVNMAPPAQLPKAQPNNPGSSGNYNNMVKAWQPGQSPYASNKPAPSKPKTPKDYGYRGNQEWAAHDPEAAPVYQRVEPPRPQQSYAPPPPAPPAPPQQNYNYVPDNQPKPMYMQPIIPGTDL